MEYTLNEAEQKLANFLAQSRYQSNRNSGVTNNKIGPQSDAETDLNGIGSELAFCRMFNVYPDMSISPRSGGADCFRSGFEIDVKTTRYPSGRLLAVTTKKLKDADIYVLMVGDFPTYRFAGFATAQELLNPEKITNLGYGPTYALSQAELHKEFQP